MRGRSRESSEITANIFRFLESLFLPPDPVRPVNTVKIRILSQRLRAKSVPGVQLGPSFIPWNQYSLAARDKGQPSVLDKSVSCF